jgi:cytidyltransferase-like protein
MQVIVAGSFDDLCSRHVRFLHEASKLGDVHLLLWPDEAVRALENREPKFPQEERLYFLDAVRYVQQARLFAGPVEPDAIPKINGLRPDVWAVNEAHDTPGKRAFCAARGIAYRVIRDKDLVGFPETCLETCQVSEPTAPHPCGRRTLTGLRKKVIVTGCYDWLHSGHVRFFEETSALGDLYVVVGHDENVRLLKGEGHPMFSQEERRYMVQAIRYVTQALISTGHGWMDAAPEIARIRPDIYAVNEDGDKPEKRAFCGERGIEYVVLKRQPKEGLPRRQSTTLRGF